MNKLLVFGLLLFFISGSFIVVFDSVFASELVEDSWSTKASMSQARAGLGVAVVDGKIYAIGGELLEGGVGANERYDPKSNTWITLKSMPTPRVYFATAAYQGKIYCISGSTDVYDTITNSWDTKAAIPSDVSNSLLQACVVNGKIYVIFVGQLRLYMYDPATDVWTEKARIPANIASSAAREPVSTTLDDDKIVVIGSFFRTISTSTMENIVLVYNSKTDTWQDVNSAPMGIVKDGAAVGATTGLYAPQKIYVFEEETNIYDPVKNTWSIAKSMPTTLLNLIVAYNWV